jgi:hypothetical protein
LIANENQDAEHDHDHGNAAVLNTLKTIIGDQKISDKKIPVTLLSGFLGAGTITLLHIIN